ncbi:hypothetical protein MSWHS_1350 [Methanosarcina sp. WWM596]|nr:hypothetical protein MSWHS_1350 [Methanosarcina sp. WWM596]
MNPSATNCFCNSLTWLFFKATSSILSLSSPVNCIGSSTFDLLPQGVPAGQAIAGVTSIIPTTSIIIKSPLIFRILLFNLNLFHLFYFCLRGKKQTLK